ncbi:NAD(P)-binding protein [Hypoxylon sp. NC1633]|nr:NAD(P)-binding protein [Hypoxylon sp. NC1633]
MSNSNYVKKIAIVGATGTIGVHIVAALQKQGKHELTAITRQDSTAAASIPAGVKVAKVDYANEATIVDALRGQDALIITMSIFAGEETQLTLIRAAAAAGVPFVLPNEWGVDSADEALMRDTTMGGQKPRVKNYVEELGKSSWIGVVMGFWYEYSLGFGTETFGMDWKNRIWTFIDDGETKMNTTTWPQSGEAVAKLLALPIEAETKGAPSLSDYKNKYVYVSSFLLTQKDMFAAVLRVTGTKESDWTIQHEESGKRFQEALKQIQGGDFSAFPKLLYSRVWFKDGGASNFEARRGLANDAIGLEKPDLDEATKIAIDRSEKGLKYH